MVDRDHIDEPSIGDRVARGAVWTISMRLIVRIFGLVNVAILARILTKADFGLIAILIAFSALLTVVLDTMVRAPLVRVPNIRDAHYGSAFLMRVTGSTVAASIIYMCAPTLGSFYEVQHLMGAFEFFALIIFIEGLASTWVVSFQREIEFHKDFIYEVLHGLTRIAGTIYFAFEFQDYRAILAGFVIAALVKVFASHAMCWGKPLKPEKSAFKDLVSVAKWSFLDAFGSFSEQRLDKLSLGKMANLGQLGLYSTVLDLVKLPIGNLVLPVTRAILPGLQKMQSETITVLRDVHAAVIGGILSVSIPMAVGMALVADPLIRTILGDNWADAIIIFEVLTLHALMSAVSHSFRQVIVALGRFSSATLLTWSRTAVYLSIMYVGFVYAGILGVAAARSFASFLEATAAGIMVAKYTHVNWAEVLKQVGRSSAATLTMAIAILWCKPFVAETLKTSWSELLVNMLGGGLVYLVSVYLIWLLAGRPEGIEARIIKLVSGYTGKGHHG